MFRRLILTCLPAFGQVAAAACDEPFAKPGPYAVSVLDEVWVDAARCRSLPVRTYIPADDVHFVADEIGRRRRLTVPEPGTASDYWAFARSFAFASRHAASLAAMLAPT